MKSEEAGLIRQAFRDLLDRGEWVGDLTGFARDGRRLRVESRRSIVRDDQGNPQGLFILEADVTERRQLEKQMMHAQRLEIIGELSGGIAHDLNNILSPVLMGAQLLASQTIDSTSRKVVETIETSAQRGIEMIRQLLSFARGGETRQGAIDLTRLLGELHGFLAQTFPRNIEVEVPPPPPGLGTVQGVATQIYQGLMNLCVNARDAMPDGGRLTVRAGRVDLDAAFFSGGPGGAPGPYVFVAVEDTGSGIAPENLPRVFEAFFTTKGEERGTGLGLSTSARIAREHGGFLRVKSEMGQGSKFMLYLPVTGGGVSDRCVLVVDDDHAVLEVLRTVLTAEGYGVVALDSGAKALEHAQTSGDRFRFLICDYRMAGVDGFETVRALRTVQPDLVCIGISGHSDPEIERRWRPLLAAYLQKPFLPSAVVALLKRHAPKPAA